MAIERHLDSEISWRNDQGELFYLHFRKADANIGHSPREKLLKSFRRPVMRHGDILSPLTGPEAANPA